MILGCIGDDFTGSSDIGGTLSAGGMRTLLYTGVPDVPAGEHVEAGIVALKSRNIPAKEAVAQSLAALDWLEAQGCRQIVFKYCSTFDSTPAGNIGPVAEALADALNADTVVFCPASPALGRTLYAGHLFVGDRLLSECGMENHPLTPMTDPDIRRWLSRQTRCAVGHVPEKTVRAGRRAIRRALADQRRRANRFIIVDALCDSDLIEIAAATSDLRLLTGGSGIALGLVNNFREQGLIGNSERSWSGNKGRAVVLSGSCSKTTRTQIKHHCQLHPGLLVEADAIISGAMTPKAAAGWALAQSDPLPLIYSSAVPALVRKAQENYGRASVAGKMEGFFAQTARILADNGFGRIIVAGGETSGALIQALAIDSLEIGPQIDPGVPALKVPDGELVLALKSGNFGAMDFFSRAAAVLARP